jgi:hypothetical protein
MGDWKAEGYALGVEGGETVQGVEGVLHGLSNGGTRAMAKP